VWGNKLKIFFKGVGGAVVLVVQVMQWCISAMSEKFFLRD
jgi:hypothetical protein